MNNLEICKSLIEVSKKYIKTSNKININFIKDRPGHDFRYAINSNKIRNKLKWKPQTTFSEGIRLTFKWYLENKMYYKSLSKKDILKRMGRK